MPTRLAGLGLDLTKPGFYDDPAFLAAERRDPRLLEAYAYFIDGISLDENYVEYVRERTHATVTFLHRALVEDGRMGACVDVSAALSRFLERQGVWN